MTPSFYEIFKALPTSFNPYAYKMANLLSLKAETVPLYCVIVIAYANNFKF